MLKQTKLSPSLLIFNSVFYSIPYSNPDGSLFHFWFALINQIIWISVTDVQAESNTRIKNIHMSEFFDSCIKP